MKKNEVGLLAVLFICLFPLAACRMATGPRFQPIEVCPPEKGLVYVYRPAASRWSSPEKDWPYLFVDGKKSASMAIGGYTLLYEEPGKHVYEIKAMFFNGLLTGSTLERIDLDIEGGTEYYLVFEQNSSGINLEALISIGLAAAAGLQSDAGPLYITRLFSQVPKDLALPQLQKTRSLNSRPEQSDPTRESINNESASPKPTH
jgi:hypothetical protein